MGSGPVQVTVHAEFWDNVSTYGFWKRVTTAIFEMRIVNLGVVSYLRMTPENYLAKADKDRN